MCVCVCVNKRIFVAIDELCKALRVPESQNISLVNIMQEPNVHFDLQVMKLSKFIEYSSEKCDDLIRYTNNF